MATHKTLLLEQQKYSGLSKSHIPFPSRNVSGLPKQLNYLLSYILLRILTGKVPKTQKMNAESWKFKI